jgi:hypothetical protein
MRMLKGYSSMLSFPETRNCLTGFQACKSFSLWLWRTSNAADECGAVRKIQGMPWLRGGWKAHDHGMLCSCTPEVYRLPRYGFSLDISGIEANWKNSQPVN